MPSRRAITALALFLAAMPSLAAGPSQGLPLVERGRSAYFIYCQAEALPSVRTAAGELQRVLRLSTGVELPIRHEPAPRMLSLGENAAASRAGLTAASLPDDGFRIVTRDSSLYILGKDTPGEPPTWVGWTSQGTLYGVYEFLERVVGARWLMPGDWGEDIPRHNPLRIPAMNVETTPDFAFRALISVRDSRPGRGSSPAPANLWLRRQKLTPAAEGRKVEHGHAWDDYVSPAMLQAHPEFRAVSGDPNKFCTSNETLTRLFAEGVIQRLSEQPGRRSASISPADGGGFCRCPRCLAMVTTDPHGRRSYTPVILDFYNRVARIVREKHLNRILGGYVYYNYMYPPEPPVRLEPNLTLVWAPLNYYGWGLAKPAYREEFPRVLAGWAAVAPRLVYHNYSTWMRSLNGAPVPPGRSILKLELPALQRAGVWGVEMVGMGAWGYGGSGNYILAKQMWDTRVDVDTLYHDWLQRAYGPGWRAMDRLFTLLEMRMQARKQREPLAYRGQMYEVNYELIADVHRPLLPEMERLYREALARTRTEAQRRRLQMFGENMVMLHYQMRKAGMLRDPEESTFYRSDAEYQQFLTTADFTLALEPYTGPIWKGEWQAPPRE